MNIQKIELPEQAVSRSVEIIDKYYPAGELRDLLLTHSLYVARKAMECVGRRGLDVDREFVVEAALLHDIGIFRTDAPGIHCHGTEPYICHGVIGRKLLDGLSMPRHALVCERHTGAGLSVDDIISQNLPLPHRDMLPLTLEEKLICYADKFFSKSGNPEEEKELERVKRMMAKHGEATLARFMELHALFC